MKDFFELLNKCRTLDEDKAIFTKNVSAEMQAKKYPNLEALPPENSSWYELAKEHNLTMADLDKFAKAYDLDMSISPDALRDRDPDKFDAELSKISEGKVPSTTDTESMKIKKLTESIPTSDLLNVFDRVWSKEAYKENFEDAGEEMYEADLPKIKKAREIVAAWQNLHYGGKVLMPGKWASPRYI